MKKLLIALAIIILVAGGAYFILDSKSEYEAPTSENGETEKVTLLVDPSLYETRTYKEGTADATFDVVYPEFRNAPDLNSSIEEFVMGAIETHTSDAEETRKIMTDGDKFPFYTSWTPVQVNEDYISFVLRLGGYLGGAHDFHAIASFNYDVKGKSEVALRDLFPNDPNYLKTISNFARKELRAKFGKNANEDMLLAGTEPTLENFSVFTILPDSTTFYFGEYQVAPYALGESKVALPRP